MIAEQVEQKWKEAILSKNPDKLIYSMIRAEIKNENIKLPMERRPIKDEAVLDLLRRMIKQRNETIDSIKDHNRPEVVEKEQREIAVLFSFLPTQLTRDQIREAVVEALSGIELTAADVGRAMSIVMPKLKGKADGVAIKSVVAEVLGGSAV